MGELTPDQRPEFTEPQMPEEGTQPQDVLKHDGEDDETNADRPLHERLAETQRLVDDRTELERAADEEAAASRAANEPKWGETGPQ